MRAAHIENNVVVNYVEAGGFDDIFIDPLDSVIGSTWDGEKFTAPAPTPITRDQAKDARQALVDNSLVTVDSMVFNGDEISQGRMARAILALTAAGQTSTVWTLANNISTSVTLAQLNRALIAAGTYKTSVWTIPA